MDRPSRPRRSRVRLDEAVGGGDRGVVATALDRTRHCAAPGPAGPHDEPGAAPAGPAWGAPPLSTPSRVCSAMGASAPGPTHRARTARPSAPPRAARVRGPTPHRSPARPTALPPCGLGSTETKPPAPLGAGRENHRSHAYPRRTSSAATARAGPHKPPLVPTRGIGPWALTSLCYQGETPAQGEDQRGLRRLVLAMRSGCSSQPMKFGSRAPYSGDSGGRAQRHHLGRLARDQRRDVRGPQVECATLLPVVLSVVVGARDAPLSLAADVVHDRLDDVRRHVQVVHAGD
jgi:hypothetical protein